MALKHNTAFLSAIMQLKGGTITFKSHLDRKDLERYGPSEITEFLAWHWPVESPAIRGISMVVKAFFLNYSPRL